MLQVSTITFLLHAIFHQYSHFIISIIFCRETGSYFRVIKRLAMLIFSALSSVSFLTDHSQYLISQNRVGE